MPWTTIIVCSLIVLAVLAGIWTISQLGKIGF